MKLDDGLKNVGVMGAAGKMGSGISLLMVQQVIASAKKNATTDARVVLFDTNNEGLEGLKTYLKKQLQRYADKKSAVVAELYGQENKGAEYVDDALALCTFTTDDQQLSGVKLLFEAIIEDFTVKCQVFSKLKPIVAEDCYFLSNTSSLPITQVDEKVGLDGRLIGFHFYNPPAVQRLVELISSTHTQKPLAELAMALGKRMGKIMVPSADVAGFIGNGHFIRDGLYALEQAQSLMTETSAPQALYLMNRVSQQYMLRPMGIFQLIDYVGIDVFKLITKSMSQHLAGNFDNAMLDKLLDDGVRGGQFSDATQRDGFFKYEGGKPVAVYDIEKGTYIGFSDGDWKQKCDAQLGEKPELSWKSLMKDTAKNEKMATYFNALFSSGTQAGDMAKAYCNKSRAIAQGLVNDGVAASIDDVNTVLMNGFFHLYGPQNELF